MNDRPPPRVGFTPADLRALRYLALVLAAIVGVMTAISETPGARLVAAIMAMVMMVAAPVAVYLFRRFQARKQRPR